MFTEKDLEQFDKKGISLSQVEQQIAKFKSGFVYSQLDAAAKIPDGMKKFDDVAVNELVDYYNQKSVAFQVVKFVPASGAASRMFKGLFAFRDAVAEDLSKAEELLEDKGFNSPAYFFEHIEDFAFYNDLNALAKQNGAGIEERLKNHDYVGILNLLLDKDGMNYGKLPKALLKFHSYESGSRYAIEEHLVEGVHYACDENGKVYLHFTVSEDHKVLFEHTLSELQPVYEEKFNVRFEIAYSIQKPETDTLAVNTENEPFRTDDGSILFRPGGHGALIQNLNELEYDIAFVKNIDNIVPDHLRAETYTYKKVIGALLLQAKAEIEQILNKLEANEFNAQWLNVHVRDFMKDDLQIRVPEEYTEWDMGQQAEYVVNKLNRPIRVCGMVKNEGEPGGGPYWVNANGDTSLQIVEKSQIDTSDPKQNEILNGATHFNPVDLVCSLKDYKGEYFDFIEFY